MQAAARQRVAALAAGDAELLEEMARLAANSAREVFYFEPKPGTVHRLVGEDDRARRLRLWGAAAVERAGRAGFR
jgi:hypothetical protein